MSRKPQDIELDDVVKGYCVKCRKKNVTMKDPILTYTQTKKGGAWRPMVQGFHKKCGTKMTRFVNQEYVDNLEIE